MLHDDKRVPITPGIPWESHQDYLPWFRRVSHLKVARGRRDGHNTESAEERTAADLVLLDSCMSGTHVSPFDMKNTLREVQRILRGQDAAHPSTPVLQVADNAVVTLVRYQLPMVVIVFNNSGVYGGQRLSCWTPNELKSFAAQKPGVINVMVDPYAGAESGRLQHKN
ncbi:hypothetical protein RHSIM_Rhsim10G0076500 [Rhododendron simsii]|uniref:Thiamine pyrophosphate enzyme TPP-binding domain-containing protein n=1 Tax=Rhododendron simsii TaxID=118357 RepID=A0A834GC22_RHOSS|nr:hypothetical protein RHSIM_Rhsim10G0076500 [Rhododendron simsii]